MLVIFDLDGTLFQAKPVIMCAITQLMRELGLPAPDAADLQKSAPQGALSMLKHILGDDADAHLPLYKALLRETITDTGELFPGVRESLERLKGEGHELIICSNSPEEYIALVLESTGIAKFISRYYSAGTYPSKAKLISELIKPGVHAVVVGDTHGDVEAAHSNGLPAIAAMYGYGNKQMLAKADAFAYSADEIPNVLYNLTSNH